MTPLITATGHEETAALEAVAHLFQALNRAGLRYCHWKSNLRLARGLRGQTDLDLLVDEAHGRAFRQLLREHQVKFVRAAAGKAYPAVENYLGFDPASGKLFHLHVHYQLVLGEQHVKNYCLPLAEHFLDAVRLQHGVQVPAPELELIVLSLRALLKYRDRDVFKDVLGIRSPGLPQHILAEVHWLLAQTSREKVAQRLAELPAVIPPELIISFLEVAAAAPRDGRKLFQLRRQARQALSPYQRRSRIVASLQYFRALGRQRLPAALNPGRKMTLPGGGLAFSLIGVDGAGKTTLASELARWLSWKLDAQLYYLGSKQPSWLSRALYWAFRAARRSHRFISGRFGGQSVPARVTAALRQGLLHAHHLATGHDRYRRYRRGQSAVERGAIAIYDRFPLAAPFDGPKIPRSANGERGFFSATLSRREQQLYHRFRVPGLLFVLRVPPETSLQRKPGHRPEAITAKHRALRQWTATVNGGPLPDSWIEIDANRPLEEVLADLKQEVWKAL